MGFACALFACVIFVCVFKCDVTSEIMSKRRLIPRVVESIRDIPASSWDACANPETSCSLTDEESFNPFISHSYLKALELSGSVGPSSGWAPRYLTIDDQSGKLLACAPAYLKSHSFGEYVFDFMWAQAYAAYGGVYYPKLQVAVPFTPVTGRRLLVLSQSDSEVMNFLIERLKILNQSSNSSSIHITFCSLLDAVRLQDRDFIMRVGEQFHFINKNFSNFDEFLAELTARKRKLIKRERREACRQGIEIERLTGKDIQDIHLEAMYNFYIATNIKKRGRPYLTKDFFRIIFSEMGDRLLLVMAKRSNDYVAGAINFLGDKAIYGRYWGSKEEIPFLHYEVCYYQAIEFAINNGYRRVEAGAQGEHKIARGYQPVKIYSAHIFQDLALNSAVKGYVEREKQLLESIIQNQNSALPFRI